MTEDRLKDKKRDAQYLVVCGVLFFIVAITLFLVFNALDIGNLQKNSIPSVIYTFYKKAGTLGATFGVALLGIICFVIGINKKRNLRNS